MNRKGWAETQAALASRGLYSAANDGLPGEDTRSAVERLLGQQETTPRTLGTRRWTYGGASLRRGVDRDPVRLLPGFADRLERVFRGMRTDGFEPMLWEGYRSFERAARLAARGTGIKRSMHCYGIAADIVDSDATHWTAPAGFWASIRNHAHRAGLHTLVYSDGSPRDYPHVQAIPVSEQFAFRAMSLREREEHVA